MLAVFRGDATHIPTAKAQSRTKERSTCGTESPQQHGWPIGRSAGRDKILDDEVPEIPIGLRSLRAPRSMS